MNLSYILTGFLGKIYSHAREFSKKEVVRMWIQIKLSSLSMEIKKYFDCKNLFT